MAFKMVLDQCYSCENECKKAPLVFVNYHKFLNRCGAECKDRRAKRLTSNGFTHMGIVAVAVDHDTPGSISYEKWPTLLILKERREMCQVNHTLDKFTMEAALCQ